MQHELFGCSSVIKAGQQDHFRVAKAGEYLAAFELTAHGADVSLAVESRPYDLLVEFEGQVIRVQVKTASSPCDEGRYGFDTKRGSHKANAKSRLYTDDEVDMFALVAFDIKRVILT